MTYFMDDQRLDRQPVPAAIYPSTSTWGMKSVENIRVYFM